MISIKIYNMPVLETNYSIFDLSTEVCTSCCELSEEILIGDGRCIDCIEEQKFYEETMKGL